MERQTYDALSRAGDAASAGLWRRLCRDLGGPLRIGIIARDLSAARRWSTQKIPQTEGIEWVSVLLDEGAHPLDLGSQDRLLSIHALLFLTPMTAPLGQAERRAMTALSEAGVPIARRVAIVDEDLLERLSDNPEAERAAVYARVEALVPEGWPVVRDLGRWLDELQSALPTLRTARSQQVGRYLLEGRAAEITAEIHALEEARERVDRELAQENQALAFNRRQTRRLAAHTLAIVRRQTERLELDLHAFLRDLEGDLPAQIHALDDVDLARCTLPHWLSHVVASWMTDRLAQWQTAVLDELEELELPDPIGLELLVPALQPAPVKGDVRWAERLGTTAAFGGAAALLMLGLWVPGLAALAGSFALSSVFGGPTTAQDRGKLVATARLAVRQMGEDAQHLLHDQIERLSAEIEHLADEDDADNEQDGARARTDLEAREAALSKALSSLRKQLQHTAPIPPPPPGPGATP